MEPQNNPIQQQLAERFSALPPSVQKAITDTSIEKKLRALAQKHKLHLDQWVLLENEIMLTLLGVEDPDNMVANVAREVHVSTDIAQAIVNDIATLVFTPIRESLQQGIPGDALERKTEKSTVESDSHGLVMPNTAPSAKEGPSDVIGPAYQAGASSLERKMVQGDPYREPLE